MGEEYVPGAFTQNLCGFLHPIRMMMTIDAL